MIGGRGFGIFLIFVEFFKERFLYKYVIGCHISLFPSTLLFSTYECLE